MFKLIYKHCMLQCIYIVFSDYIRGLKFLILFTTNARTDTQLSVIVTSRAAHRSKKNLTNPHDRITNFVKIIVGEIFYQFSFSGPQLRAVAAEIIVNTFLMLSSLFFWLVVLLRRLCTIRMSSLFS